MRFSIILLLLVVCNNVFSQRTIKNSKNDTRIDSLVKKRIEINKLKNGVNGFRVQIHHNQSQNREESQKVRAIFSKDFPMLKTYLEFKSPYYKIQVGDFVSKLEAHKLYKKISRKYRGSYIVPAIVNLN